MGRQWWIVAVTIVLGSGPAAAQDTLTLSQALERASKGAWANRIAAAQAEARDGEALQPYRGILPTVRLESGLVATTDPLGAFGFTLRQRTVTPAAFAPERLNYPSATHGLSTSLTVEQPLINPDAWLGRRAAARARDAAASNAEWIQSGTAVEVTRAYWGAVLAGEKVATLRVASAAAESHRKQAEALVRQGMATRSDALLAEVKAGEVRAELLEAESQARLSRLGLALAMGAPEDSGFLLPSELPTGVTAPLDSESPPPRRDVVAANQAYAAAKANAARAGATYLPRLNGFGRLDWNTPGTPFGGKSAWTVGVMLSWAPFSGASELADRRISRAQRDQAGAAAEAAAASAELERIQAQEHLHVALERLDIATSAALQSAEAHRIVSRKYDGGLATVTELFEAAAVETGSRLARSKATYDALSARAELDRVSGRTIQ